MRIKDHSGPVPKPMVCIGYRPVLWHVMKYYAHYGHKDFILCLGHGGDQIKDYFVRYDETRSNDFVLDGGKVSLLSSDLDDWRITFVDTGLNACVGERLLAVRPYLEGEEVFLANYSDGVTDAPLDDLVAHRERTGAAACFLGVRPNYTSHVIRADGEGRVTDITHVTEIGLRINGGFFAFHQRVFDYIRPGEELLHEPFQRMAAAGDLVTYRYDGFWACMDTFKEKRLLEDIHHAGDAPWEVWNRPPRESYGPSSSGDGLPEVASALPA